MITQKKAAECWQLMCDYEIEFRIEENDEHGEYSKDYVTVFVGKTGTWTDVAVEFNSSNPVESYTKALELAIKEIKSEQD